MFKSGTEPLVLNWNRLAMEHLKDDKLEDAFKLLKKSEDFLKYPDCQDSTKLLSITYNNFGCYYRKCQKYQLAAKYLTWALDIELSSLSDKMNLAGTNLNLCSVYSCMNLHSKAVAHGVQAVKLFKEVFETDKSNPNVISLVIALNNTGFEYEKLKETDNALGTYKCGVDLANKYLGADHQVSLALFKSYSNLLSSFSYKSTSIKSYIKKRKSTGLPTIKTLNVRNKSLGSKNRVLSNAYEKGTRANSNKTFIENSERNTFISKPKTVPKRQKRVLKNNKVFGLEEKITELQSQISIFQQKYKVLENRISQKFNKQQAAVVIQRFWRKQLKKRQIFMIKGKNNREKLLKNFGKKPCLPLHPKSSYFSSQNRFYKPIHIPLDPIRESKIESKEMKAVLIQSFVRMFLAKRRYQRIKKSILKIQRKFRDFQGFRLFSNIRQAVICIQRFWRFKKGRLH